MTTTPHADGANKQSFTASQEGQVPSCHPRVIARTRTGGGDNKQELREYSLFAQYVARIEKMPREIQEGHTEYKPLLWMDFEKLSRRRQVVELQRLGILVENGEESKTFYSKTDEGMYPTTHVDTNLPPIQPRSLATAELLHHQNKIEDKIIHLYKRLRELRRETRHCM